ncbi:hypothetical protein GCM10023260_16020 [Bartonella acomydis]|uniref:Uncharacterized protein n=2 Tax=Bartonella acomydis TaxID=686234 RepID=A0ABP9MX61_9HYPH
MYGYDNIGLKLYGHSRADMILGNMLYTFKQEGIDAIVNNTNINLYVPAFNAFFAAGLLAYVSEGK